MPCEVPGVMDMPRIDWPIVPADIPGAKASASIFCRCGAHADVIRGHVAEFPRCVDLRGAYVCLSCRSVYPLRLRWHFKDSGETDSILSKQGKGWIRFKKTKPFWKKIIDFLHFL